MNGVNKWKDELAAMTRERNKIMDKWVAAMEVEKTIRAELTLSREAVARLTERIRELESRPAFDINTIFGGKFDGKP